MVSLLIGEITEPSTIMYIFGIIFGILSVLYFAKDILLSLSITTKNYALFLLSFGIFAIGSYVSSSVITLALIVVSAFAYSISVLYTWNRNPLTRTSRFILLLISSVIFMGVAFGINNSIFETNSSILIVSLVVGSLLFLVISALDTREDDLQYKISLEESSDVSDGMVLGEITVKNDGLFRREFSMPSISCQYELDQDKYDIPISIDRNTSGRFNKTIGRGESIEQSILCEISRLDSRGHDLPFDVPDRIEISGPDSIDRESEIKILISENN